MYLIKILPNAAAAALFLFICGNFCPVFSVNNANATGSYVEVQQNSTSWMESIAEEIANKDLREIVLPGTHDAGSREWQGWGADHLVETQNYTINEQLNYGIRYLDFRVTYNSGDNAWIFSHAGWDMEDKVYTALDNIKTFLDRHPKEIVIIDFQHFPEIDDSDDQANLPNLRTKLMNTLGVYMVPFSKGVHTKLQTLWNENKRAIVLMTDSVYNTFSSSQQASLWKKSSSIESPWPDAADEEDAIRYLDGKIAAMNSGYASHNYNHYNKFYVVQGISTASKSVDSLWDGANDTNPAVLSILEGNSVPLISNDWRNSPLNIIIMDYVDTVDFVPVVKSMNMDSIKNGAGNLDDGVYLYEHGNYGGYFTRLNETVSYLSGRFIVDQNGYDDHTNFNDEVSSVKIIGNYKVELFEHTNFGGASVTYTGNSTYVGNFNDRASSAKIYRWKSDPAPEPVCQEVCHDETVGCDTIKVCETICH